MSREKVIICGGGTGGHVYPALVLGQKLKERKPDLELTYVGTDREEERRILASYQVHFVPLKVEGLKGKGFKTVRSLFILPFSLFKSLRFLHHTRPHLVVGVGGYSSGPVVLMASLLGMPTLLLEQNAYPGLTNRLLARWVKKAVVSFPSTLEHFRGKGVYIGNPVRDDFYHLPRKPRENILSVLVFGGSQGSHFLNKAMVNALPLLREEKDSLRIFHQTGEKDFDWVKENYAQNGFAAATISPYFFDMPQRYSQADLIICRAGATTIAELIASQKAAILIPFSGATDNHQEKNARELEKIGAAEVILEEEYHPEKLTSRIRDFLKNKEKLSLLEKNLAFLRQENVAEKISELCFSLIKSFPKEKKIG